MASYEEIMAESAKHPDLNPACDKFKSQDTREEWRKEWCECGRHKEKHAEFQTPDSKR